VNPLLEALGWVGNVLDTPGSVVRGMLAGDPSRAMGGVFDPEQRVGGREMLETWGALDPNEEGLDWGDAAGFGADVLLDPLSLLGAGAGAKLATKGAKRAATGLADEAGQLGKALTEFHADEVGSMPNPFAGSAPAAGLAPTFYSRLEEAAKTLPDTVKTQSLMNMLKKAPGGFSPEEAQWRGLEEFLGKQGPKTDKNALLEHLASNKIQVDEVVKGKAAQHDWVDIPATTKEGPRWQLGDTGLVISEEAPISKGMFAPFHKPSGERFGWAAYPSAEEAIEGGRHLARHGMPVEQIGTKELFHDRFVLRDMNDGGRIIESSPELHRLQASARGLRKALEEGEGGATRWAEHRTPGGENYKEMLLTLPSKGIKEVEYLKKMAQLEEANEAGTISMSAFNAAQNVLDDAVRAGKLDAPYQSSHWDEPNILAHMRYQDKIDPATGRKALHIEEVQSDWHQAGKKTGYKGSPENKAAFENFNGLTDAVQALEEQAARSGIVSARSASAFPNDRLDYLSRAARNSGDIELRLQIEDLRREADATISAYDAARAAVPDAPFKDVWQELAMKRMLREAAEKGYDDVTWSGGDVVKSLVNGEGAGQRQFYDEVLPNWVNKYTKQYGGKVESGIQPGMMKPEGLYDAAERAAQDMPPALKEKIVAENPSLVRELGEFSSAADDDGLPFGGLTLNELVHESIEAVASGNVNKLQAMNLEDLGPEFMEFIQSAVPQPRPGLMHRLPLTEDLKAMILGRGQPLMNLAGGAGGGGLLAAALMNGGENG
jgi:hypothetical protein